MLSLDRPLGLVADLALFGDHADPARVYWVATRPRLARSGDEAELAMLRFTPSDASGRGGVGLVSFTTELVASEAQLEAAREHLEDQGIAEPELVQVPWTGGRAVLAAALEEGDGFVERLFGEVTPDLAGGNRAVFSLLLNEDGVRLFEGLLRTEEGPSPLGVRYELAYDGLRPAFDVRLRADYSRLYDEFAAAFQFGVAYQGIGVRAGVEVATKELIEAGAIEIEVLHFTDGADVRRQVDEAVAWFQDRILHEFFASSIQPPAHKGLLERATAAAIALGAATLQEALADAQLLAQLAEQLGLPTQALQGLGKVGGAGGAAGGAESTFALNLQFQLRDIRQEERKVVTVDWSQAQAESRTAAPQALLADLGTPPRITEASDDEGVWERLTVAVRPLGDFEALGVERLIVELAYPDEITARSSGRDALTFEAGDPAPQTFSVWTDGGDLAYRARTTVHFADDGPWPGPPTSTGPWATHRELELAVHPLTAVPRLDVGIAPGTVDFAQTPQVQLDFALDGDLDRTVLVSEASPDARYRRRLDGGPPEVEDGLEAPADPGGAGPAQPRLWVRPTWFMATGPPVPGAWAPVEGTTLLVHRPWRSQRGLRLFPMLPLDFHEAIVTVELVDERSTPAQVVRFTPGDRASVPVALPSLRDQPPPARLHTLVIRADGTVFSGEVADVTDPVVVIQDREGRHRRLTVQLVAEEQLRAHGVIAVQVELLGPQGEVLDSVAFTQSQRDPAMLLLPLLGGDVPVARYRIVRYGLDGRPSPGETVESTDDVLLIPASPAG